MPGSGYHTVRFRETGTIAEKGKEDDPPGIDILSLIRRN